MFGIFGSSKTQYGLYCAISGNEPSSVALFKLATNARLLCCNFEKPDKAINEHHSPYCMMITNRHARVMYTPLFPTFI